MEGGITGLLASQGLAIGAISLWLTLLALAALALRRRWPEQREWSRKLVHVGCGPVILLAWGLGLERGIALAAAAVITLLAALNHRLRVLPVIEDVGRASYGTVAYGAAITVLLWLYWPSQAAAVAAGVLVMAWGDGLAGLVGASLASPSWRVWGQRKSLAGTSAMALASLTALLLLQTLLPGAGWPSSAEQWLVLLGITLVACLLEQVAILGLDNLSVPLVVGWLWQWSQR
ncbi:MAG: dolichol kinase [Synechococcus sp.]